MEIDSKDSEIEQLSQKLASASADTQSNISSGAENECEDGVQVSPLLFFSLPTSNEMQVGHKTTSVTIHLEKMRRKKCQV